MTDHGETFVDQLLAAAQEAREVLGELRSEVRETRRFLRDEVEPRIVELRTAVRAEANAMIAEEVGTTLDEYKRTLRDAITRADDAILQRFDRIYRTILAGRGGRGEAKGGLDLGALILDPELAATSPSDDVRAARKRPAPTKRTGGPQR